MADNIQGNLGQDFWTQLMAMLGQNSSPFGDQSITTYNPATGKNEPTGQSQPLQHRILQDATKDSPFLGVVDPRTPGIKAAELAGLMQMLGVFQNPQGLANSVLSGTGTAPSRDAANTGLEGSGAAANPLMQMIFGGSAGGATGTPWTPPGRGGTGGTGGAPPSGGTPGTPAGPAGPSGPTVGAPGGYFPTTPGAGTGAGTSWGEPQVPSGLPSGMPQTQPGFQNFNPQGAADPQGNYNRDGQWIGAGLGPEMGADQIREILLKQQGHMNPGSAPINWEAYGLSGDAGHAAVADQAGYDEWMKRPGASSWDSDKGKGVSVGNESRHFQFRADGGMMDPSKMTIVGEQGPEAIVPTAQGQQVVPLGQGGGGAMDPTAMIQMLQLMMGGAKGMAEGGILPPLITDPNQPIFENTMVNSTMGTGGQTNPTGNPGEGLGNPPPMAGNTGQFSPTQQPGALGQAAAFNPELDAFNSLKDALGMGWGSQANTAFNTGAGMLGQSQGAAADTRNLASGSFVTPEIQNSLTGQMTTNPGQGVMDALQPVWQQNLQSAFGQLNASAPSIFNSAQQLQGADLGRSALNDFNLLSSQALQQGVGQQQNAASILGQLLGQNKQMNLQGLGQAGTLGQGNAAAMGQLGQGAANADNNTLQTLLGGAQSAGAGQFGRLNQAAQTGMGAQQQGEQSRQFNLQYDLAAQNQAYNQQMNPTLQLLLAAMGLSEPTGLQTVVGSQKA